jgi:hypothetical protein
MKKLVITHSHSQTHLKDLDDAKKISYMIRHVSKITCLVPNTLGQCTIVAVVKKRLGNANAIKQRTIVVLFSMHAAL